MQNTLKKELKSSMAKYKRLLDDKNSSYDRLFQIGKELRMTIQELNDFYKPRNN